MSLNDTILYSIWFDFRLIFHLNFATLLAIIELVLIPLDMTKGIFHEEMSLTLYLCHFIYNT